MQARKSEILKRYSGIWTVGRKTNKRIQYNIDLIATRLNWAQKLTFSVIFLGTVPIALTAGLLIYLCCTRLSCLLALFPTNSILWPTGLRFGILWNITLNWRDGCWIKMKMEFTEQSDEKSLKDFKDWNNLINVSKLTQNSSWLSWAYSGNSKHTL